MSEEMNEELIELVRDAYNPPPETPRDEMWSRISERLGARGADVVDLGAARRARARRLPGRWAGWATAAAAVLVVGIGIGRVTAPVPGVGEPGEEAAAEPERELSFVAAEHLSRSESLLTLVRADARQGRLDPAVVPWAKSLLTETRLLLDLDQSSPAVQGLLEDLELVLAQIVGATDGGQAGGARERTELGLALEGMQQSEVLSRIQAVVPGGPTLNGTD